MPRVVRETTDRSCFRRLLRDARGEISAGTHWGRTQLFVYEEVARRGTVDLPFSVVSHYCCDGVEPGAIGTLLGSIRKQAIREGASKELTLPAWTRPPDLHRRAVPPPLVERAPSPPPSPRPVRVAPSPIPGPAPPRPAPPPPVVHQTGANELTMIVTAAYAMARGANMATPGGRVANRLATLVAHNPRIALTFDICETILAYEPGSILFDLHAAQCDLARAVYPSARLPRWPGPSGTGADVVGRMDGHLADTLRERGLAGVHRFLENNDAGIGDAMSIVGALADWTPLLQAWSLRRAQRIVAQKSGVVDPCYDGMISAIILTGATPAMLFAPYAPGNAAHDALVSIIQSDHAWTLLSFFWTQAHRLLDQVPALAEQLAAARARFLGECARPRA